MKALILVGGYGTRLRPLTLSCPKPCVPFANIPMIIHQIRALKEVGVTEVILAVAYRPEDMKDEMAVWEEQLGVKITYSLEEVPLGTAGPLALAEDRLVDAANPEAPFFVFNSDVTNEFPLSDFLAFHKESGGEATICVTKVDDPSKFGVVVSDPDTGSVQRFVEKPQVWVGDCINAGMYILQPSVLQRIPRNADGSPKPTSIEKIVFPAIAKDQKLFAFQLKGFWMDLGQPRDFVVGLRYYLQHLDEDREKARRYDQELCSEERAESLGFSVVGKVLIHPSATVGAGCVLGPNCSIGPKVVIEPGVRIRRAAVFEGCHIGAHSFVQDSILGWVCRIGKWCRIDNGAVLGRDVTVRDELYVNGAKVLPHKEISNHIVTPEVVM